MTRIVAGRWRSRRLAVPKGQVTRPTSAKVRGAIGNALEARGIVGAAVLDLFAGSGALGIELASRGADRVVFVERSPTAAATIRRNLEALDPGAGARCDVVVASARAFAAIPGEAFDIVVADPPYDLPLAEITDLLAALAASGRLRPGADIVVEHAARAGDLDWPEPVHADRVKRYGDTVVCYGRAP